MKAIIFVNGDYDYEEKYFGYEEDDEVEIY